MERSSKIQKCIKDCVECSNICMQTISHCLNMGGKHADPAHINLLLDCAEICKLSADAMLRSSANEKDICRLCAEICDKCAKSCEGLEGEIMKKCAEACKKCSESCRDMT